MALPEEIKDQFSEEKFMVGDNSETLYRSEDEKNTLGGAFEVLEGDSYQQNVNRNERLAKLVPDLQKENEALKIELTKNLPDPEEKIIDIDNSSLSAFTKSVGDSFINIAKEVPKKIEEISKDPVKSKNFIRGLEIINASSGIKPIGQAKSPLGSISEGLLKAEKGFIAKDLAEKKIEADKLKSAAAAKSKYKSGKETALEKLYTTYAGDFETNRKNYQSVDTRFNEIYKLAQGGKETPTGILESSFAGLEKVLNEIGLLDEANALIGRNKDTKEFSDEDLIKFKEIFSAATKRQIVGQVKELYPVSNKDIEILLQTVGDISTSPKALRALVAAEKAAKEISDIAFGKSYDIAFAGDGNSNFRAESQDAAAKELANKFKDKVSSETLIELYGTAENNTPFQIVNAYYHQQLEPVYKDQEEKGYFEVFKQKKEEDQEDIINIIKKRQENEK
tara:strand:- start:2312 stop:3661 length:1350 start_codon:yes stop_codon:yes gene_type:complete